MLEQLLEMLPLEVLARPINSQRLSLSRIEIENYGPLVHHLSEEGAAMVNGAAHETHSSNAIADDFCKAVGAEHHSVNKVSQQLPAVIVRVELFPRDCSVSLFHRDMNRFDRVTLAILNKEVLEDGDWKTLLHLHIDGSVAIEVQPISQEGDHLLSAPEVAAANGKVV